MESIGRFWALAFAVALVASCTAQSAIAQSQWWKSAEGSPLSFSAATGGRYLDLLNRSDKTVVQYTLGCVLFSKPSPKITKRLNSEKRVLAPREGVSELLVTYRRIYDYCPDTNAKLSIVEAVFDDGTIWTLQNSEHSTSKP